MYASRWILTHSSGLALPPILNKAERFWAGARGSPAW